LTPDEKKSLNLKRTLAQKRKKQREKEMAQLEASKEVILALA
jgi:hypothetical protein